MNPGFIHYIRPGKGVTRNRLIDNPVDNPRILSSGGRGQFYDHIVSGTTVTRILFRQRRCRTVDNRYYGPVDSLHTDSIFDNHGISICTGRQRLVGRIENHTGCIFNVQVIIAHPGIGFITGYRRPNRRIDIQFVTDTNRIRCRPGLHHQIILPVGGIQYIDDIYIHDSRSTDTFVPIYTVNRILLRSIQSNRIRRR